MVCEYQVALDSCGAFIVRELDHLALPLQGVIKEATGEEEDGNISSQPSPVVNHEVALEILRGCQADTVDSICGAV